MHSHMPIKYQCLVINRKNTMKQEKILNEQVCMIICGGMRYLIFANYISPRHHT